MNFSQKAKELREFSGLSQMELSKKIGISAAAIGFLETHTNEPKGATVAAYAKYFDVSADYLLGLEDETGAHVPSAPIPISDKLTGEERQLIENYRELNTPGKKLIQEAAKTLRATSAGSEQKNNKSSL